MATATTAVSSAKYLTTPEVAKLLGINQDKVLAWIRAGELRATNIATRANGRPRFRILEDDLNDFLARRATQATGSKPSRARKRTGYTHHIPL